MEVVRDIAFLATGRARERSRQTPVVDLPADRERGILESAV
jgi:hypothetical protein